MSLEISRSGARIALLCLTAFAVALRLHGLDFLLPQGTLGDEWVYATALDQLAHHPEFDPSNLRFYPHLVPRLALLFRHEAVAAPDALGEHLSCAAQDVLLLRTCVALLSALVVPATYLIARRFLERGPSLLAAGLTGTSFLGLWYSQQARPHGAFAALAALTLLGALEVRRRGDLRAWVLAGLAAAMAIGTLQSGVFVLLPLALAHLLPRGKRSWPGALLALLLIGLSVRICYPFLFPGPHTAELPWSVQFTGQPSFRKNFSGAGFPLMLRWLRDYDPWLAVCAALGLALCIRGWMRRGIPAARRGDAAVVAALIGPLVLVFGLYRLTQARYLLPMVPFLALAVAGGLQELRRGFPALALLMFLPQAALALLLSNLRASDDTSELAARWIEEHVQRSERVAQTPGLELPLVRDAGGQAWIESYRGDLNHPWPAYQNNLPADVRAQLGWPLVELPFRTEETRARLANEPERTFRELAARYVVLYSPDRSASFARARAETRARGSLVQRFSPWRSAPEDARPLLGNDVEDPNLIRGNWVWHVLRARCPGPVIEIYRLGDSAR